MNPVQNILGNNKIKCWNCGKLIDRSEAFYYYHGDQDNLVCETCAKKLKHTDTAYAGLNVYKTGTWTKNYQDD